jgi:hypothetical protein
VRGWRSNGYREAAIGLGVYGASLLVRQMVWNDRGRARAEHNARRIAGLERRLHLDVETPVQTAAMRWPNGVLALNAGYAVGNGAITAAALMWQFRRRDVGYRRERVAAVTAFLGALPCFAALPTAPPRTLDGYVDTMGSRGWNLDHPVLLRLYNPIAAMPSLHVALAVVTGVGFAARAAGPIGRAGWLAYPGAVTLVVLATGNHFLLDVVAGAALGGAARAVARAVVR